MTEFYLMMKWTVFSVVGLAIYLWLERDTKKKD